MPYSAFKESKNAGNHQHLQRIGHLPDAIFCDLQLVFVNKSNYSEELLRKTKICNVSILTEKTPFDVFKQFGFQSGRDVDKFEGGMYATSENGLYYLPDYANAVLSAKVVDCYDYDTHTLFVAEVTEAKTLNADKSVTYEYYQNNIKPKPQAPKTEEKSDKGKWVCKVCGYVHVFMI